MAITWRVNGTGGATSGTGDRTVAFTPAVGDLLVVGICVSTNTNDTPTCADNQSGTYTRVGTVACTINATGARMSVFVRDARVASAVSHTLTFTTGSNTAGAIIVAATTGGTRSGSSAIRSSGIASNGASGVAPAAALSQNALTNNLTMLWVGSEDTTTTPPTNWTEPTGGDTSQATPTTAIAMAYRNSGFTSTTITAGATQGATWGAIALELDDSALAMPVGAYARATRMIIGGIGAGNV